jgi:hypothetical protein
MRFENLMKQTLQLIKFRNIIIKTRKIEYKTERTTTLMKKIKSIMRKSVNEYLINLLKTIKSRSEKSISSVNVKLDDLTKVMRKMTMNVNNLINCVFLSSDRSNFELNQFYFSQMSFRYSQSNSLYMLDSRLFSMFFSKYVFSKYVVFEYVFIAFE